MDDDGLNHTQMNHTQGCYGSISTRAWLRYTGASTSSPKMIMICSSTKRHSLLCIFPLEFSVNILLYIYTPVHNVHVTPRCQHHTIPYHHHTLSNHHLAWSHSCAEHFPYLMYQAITRRSVQAPACLLQLEQFVAKHAAKQVRFQHVASCKQHCRHCCTRCFVGVQGCVVTLHAGELDRRL